MSASAARRPRRPSFAFINRMLAEFGDGACQRRSEGSPVSVPADRGGEGPMPREGTTMSPRRPDEMVPALRRLLRRAAPATLLLSAGAVSACEGDIKDASPGGISVEGNVGGYSIPQAFNIAYAGCPAGDKNESCTDLSDTRVFLANRSDEGSCSYARTTVGCPIEFGNSVEVEVGVSDGNTVTLGTYPASGGIVPGQPRRHGFVRLITTDDNCFTGPILTATGGTIVVSAVSASGIAGSFQATFADGGSFTGTFDAKFCVVDAAYPPVCQIDAARPSCLK